MDNLEAQVKKRIANLAQGNFKVKIIDFGLACRLNHGDCAKTPCGTLDVIAPEALKSGCDHRADVWGVGLIAYMLLVKDFMFADEERLHKGTWQLPELNCSIDLLQFIC